MFASVDALSWYPLLVKIESMCNDPLISSILEAHDSAILLETLQIDPGYLREINSRALEEIRKNEYIECCKDIKSNFRMFGLCPVAFERRMINGQSCKIPVIPQFGSWDVVTEPAKNGQTKITIIDRVDVQIKYHVFTSARFSKAFNHFRPGVVKSQMGKLLSLYENVMQKEKDQTKHNNRYFEGKAVIQKITPKINSEATDGALAHLINSNVNDSNVPKSEIPVDEMLSGKTCKVLPNGYEMTTTQTDFQHKEVYDIKAEKLLLMRILAITISEPIDQLLNFSSTGNHANVRYIEESRNSKTSAVILEINDIIQTLQAVWKKVYGQENTAITINHNLLLDIDDLIKLQKENIIDDELMKELAHQRVGIKKLNSSLNTVKTNDSSNSKKTKTDESD